MPEIKKIISIDNTLLQNDSRALIETIDVGVQICALDKNYTMLSCNSNAASILGYDEINADSIGNINFATLMHPDDVEKFTNDFISNELSKNGFFSIEFRITDIKGNFKWVLEKGSIYESSDGTQKLQSLLFDITENKKQEEILKLLTRKYEIAMNSSNLKLFEYDITTKTITLFDSYYKPLGLSKVISNGPATLIEQGIISPSSASEYLRLFEEVSNGNTEASAQVIINNNPHENQYCEITLSTVFSDAGVPIYAIGVQKDIKEYKELLRENQFANNLVNSQMVLLEANLTKDKILFLNAPEKEKKIVSGGMSYSNFLSEFSLYSANDDIQEILSIDNLLNNFAKGETTCELQCMLKDNETSSSEFRWFNITANLIDDASEGSSQIYLRLYLEDIHKEKMLENKYKEEHEAFQSILANKASISYEINLNQDVFLQGTEQWLMDFNITPTSSYSEKIIEIANTIIHEDDKQVALSTLGSTNLLLSFARDEKQVSCEYRRLCKDGQYHWWESQVHLFLVPETKDVCGFVYLKDIDVEKKERLALQFNAEHDLMTNLFNKVFTESLITDNLTKHSITLTHCGLLMIDLDNFKMLNDTFGHAYGDKVLIDIANKIKSMFRQEDIIGRIGGDEFCVFSSGISSHEHLRSKASKLCDLLKNTYTVGDNSVTVSASIGLAFTDDIGFNAKDLLKHGDEAMYRAKHAGKNRVSS